jgi:hypothetical protein
MFNLRDIETEPPRVAKKATGLCLTLALFTSIIGGRGTAQQTTTGASQCEQGRAMSLGVNISAYGDMVTSGPMLQALEQSGVGWARTYIQWGWVERAPGVYDWQIVDADLGKEVGTAHLHVLGVIMGPTPCWSLEYPDKNCARPQQALPKKEDWSKFVSAVVSRYKDRISYWEIWNEPNNLPFLNVQDIDQRLNGYREQILIPGAQAVHAAQPWAKVVAPVFGASQMSNKELTDNFKLAMKAPAAQLVDVVSFHAYSPACDLNEKAIEMRNAMRSMGIANKSVWITETGIILGPVRVAATSATQMKSIQANHMQTNVASVLASGNVQKVFWFDLTDGHDSLTVKTSSQHFGLVDVTDTQFKARPAFTALQQLAQSLCH